MAPLHFIITSIRITEEVLKRPKLLIQISVNYYGTEKKETKVTSNVHIHNLLINLCLIIKYQNY